MTAEHLENAPTTDDDDDLPSRASWMTILASSAAALGAVVFFAAPIDSPLRKFASGAFIVGVGLALVAWLLRGRRRRAEAYGRALVRGERLATWDLDEPDWSRWLSWLQDTQRDLKPATWAASAALALTIGSLAGIARSSPKVGVVAGVAVGILFLGWHPLRRLALRRAVRKYERGPRRVLINPWAVQIAGQTFAWGRDSGRRATIRLERAQLLESPPPTIRLELSHPHSRGSGHQRLHLPVPPGREDEARAVVDALNERTSHN